MTNKELEQKLNKNQKILEELSKEKITLETENSVIRQYMAAIASIEQQQTYQNFLKTLEIGIDGTVFEQYKEPHTKSFNMHFGLSSVLEYAFDLLQQESKKELDYYQISFQNILDYIENAKLVLNEMRYIEGDQIAQNQFGLEIYKNPKKYSVVNFKELIPMTTKQLQAKYDAKGIFIQDNSFITMKPNPVTSNLTPREKEAFYGKGAKQTLGITPHKVKEKVKI